MTKVKKVKRKLNKKRFITFIVICITLVIFIYKILNTNIKNIYISGNEMFKDQEIIDIAELSDYPNSISNLTFKIKKRLNSNKYILSSEVSKNIFLDSVYITVKENYPLFYYQTEGKTILYNGDKVSETFSIPTVINQIPNVVYDKFLSSMQKINKEILQRMSEIKYSPNEVDEERFLIIMNDGNYVYLNIKKFLNINKYVDMVKSFNNKKGILYLDSGEYFDVFEK